ncbi:MAG: FIST N-terminal domain-containing protein [Candidatus Thermoplasmatota archaeon]
MFSTIHYEKHGGFQEFLNGVWEVMPEGTPLIGGTFSGFANNKGCFTRGATALAVSSDQIKVKIGYGKNIKRSPKKACKNLIKMLKNNAPPLYKNRYIFEFISSGTVPKFTRLGRTRVLKVPRLLNKAINPTFSILTRVFQYGVGREEEVLEFLAKSFPDHLIFGGSTSDDNKWERSYQFFNNQVFQHSIVALSIETNLNNLFASQTGFTPTGIKMKPTKIGNFNCSIVQLDGKPAFKEFSSRIGWPETLFDERLHRKTLYYPLGANDENGQYLRLVALVIGSNLVFSNRVKPIDLEIYTASGKGLMDAIDTAISTFNGKKEDIIFSFVVSCTARLEALGRHIYSEQKKLEKCFREKPFIIVYASGEDSIGLSGKWVRRNESFNIMSFYKGE